MSTLSISDRTAFGGDLWLDEGVIEMTEIQWLTSNDPQKMYRMGYSGDRAKEFVDECRSICTCQFLNKSELSIYSWILIEEARDKEKGCPLRAITKCHLLREIFGNPFRPVVREKDYLCDVAVHARVFDCAKELSRTVSVLIGAVDKQEFKKILPTLIFKEDWITPTVASIAQGIYEKQDFESMGILADALEDSGCGNSQVMEYLRVQRCKECNGSGKDYSGSGSNKGTSMLIVNDCKVCEGKGEIERLHVRGCWVLELLGAKEVKDVVRHDSLVST